MQTVKAYEFKDLAPEVAEKVRDEYINFQVEADLQFLFNDLESERITEEECYRVIGCSKSYADSTAWFVPSCYYEHNKEEVDEAVAEMLDVVLFNERGTVIGNKEVEDAVAQSS